MTKTPAKPLERAVVFVDGNNCWHALHNLGVSSLKTLNYGKVSRKIIGHREWIGTRYYVGQVQNTGTGVLYNQQRQYLNFLTSYDPRVTVHLGRLESRVVVSKTAMQLKRYLADLKVRIDLGVYKDLVALGNATEFTEVFEEKAVDVALAVDMVMMAQRDEYDSAYILSADGDFTPAAKAVRDLGKKVFGASPAQGAQLGGAVTTFIPLLPEWFDDCFD